MTQVILMHGGDTFNSQKDFIENLKTTPVTKETFTAKRADWKRTLQDNLGESFEVLFPRMPNKDNARWEEWKVWFERIFPFLEDEVILVGHSMGGIFLAKYLSENNFPARVRASFLIAAPFDEADTHEALGDFNLPENLDGFSRQVVRIVLYQSKDDPVVPFVDLGKYQRLLPSAETRVFEDRGHFADGELPELVREIKAFA